MNDSELRMVELARLEGSKAVNHAGDCAVELLQHARILLIEEGIAATDENVFRMAELMTRVCPAIGNALRDITTVVP